MNILNGNIYNFIINYLPLKETNVNILATLDYSLKMNTNQLKKIYDTLEEERKYIVNKYGSINEQTGKVILYKNIDQALSEFNDLLQIEQEIPIIPIHLSWMENINITLQQISAMLFMIKNDAERKESYKMLLTNDQIYSYAIGLQENFKNYDSMLPAQVAFYIAHNQKVLTQLAINLEQRKRNLIDNHQPSGEKFSEKEINEINQELTKILNESMEVELYLFNLKELEKCNFTLAQIQSLAFMINSDNDKKEDI